jgi:hypothetical protein
MLFLKYCYPMDTKCSFFKHFINIGYIFDSVGQKRQYDMEE